MTLEDQFDGAVERVSLDLDPVETEPRDLAVELFNVAKAAKESVGRTVFKLDGSRESVSVPFDVQSAFFGEDILDFSMDVDGMRVEAILSPGGVMQMHVNGEKVQGSYDTYLQQVLEAVQRA